MQENEEFNGEEELVDSLGEKEKEEGCKHELINEDGLIICKKCSQYFHEEENREIEFNETNGRFSLMGNVVKCANEVAKYHHSDINVKNAEGKRIMKESHQSKLKRKMVKIIRKYLSLFNCPQSMFEYVYTLTREYFGKNASGKIFLISIKNHI